MSTEATKKYIRINTATATGKSTHTYPRRSKRLRKTLASNANSPPSRINIQHVNTSTSSTSTTSKKPMKEEK
jgi:hypothetical protein